MNIYNPVHPVLDVAEDWSLNSIQHRDLVRSNINIATVPVLYDDPNSYTYCASMCDIDLSEFDLVLLSDIEYTPYPKIYDWIGRHRIRNFAVAVGGLFADCALDLNHMVYRPWWMQNVVRLNQDYVPSCDATYKPFMFDALLGTRRPHRDYVMLQMQRHPGLLAQCIVTYRDVFTAGAVPRDGHRSQLAALQDMADLFADHELAWPYVSDNLDSGWEVANEITHSVSQTIPAKIYEQTWYSIICETVHTGPVFFMAEKFTKTVLAKRAFVLFGPQGYLARLKELGFQTFGSVIDESYDAEPLDLQRYQMAWAQVLSLSHQDPLAVNQRLRSIFQHNVSHLQWLWQKTQIQRAELLKKKINQSI